MKNKPSKKVSEKLKKSLVVINYLKIDKENIDPNISKKIFNNNSQENDDFSQLLGMIQETSLEDNQ